MIDLAYWYLDNLGTIMQWAILAGAVTDLALLTGWIIWRRRRSAARL